MGKHEPQNPPVDDHFHEATADYASAYTAPTDTPLGPRRAAARSRSRKKRTLLVASAAGLTLVVGGGAAAAVITSDITPPQATTAVGIPDAQPDPLVPSTEPGEVDPQLREQADQARSQATRSQSATASAVQEEPEPEEDEPASESSSDGGGEGTGQGGTCQASFYGDGFHGATTANGETFDTYGMTAAHKTLPFDTMVEVTNPNNGKSVTVRINDRGPYIDGRCLDLSTAAFDQIIGTGSGVGTVDWQVVG